MTLSILVAVAENGVIGREGGLPWRLPTDLRRFRQLTMGRHVIMGRKTFESIGRPLPGRTMIVVTRRPDFEAPGALIAASLDEAMALAKDDPEPFVIGGAELFREALPRADRLYLTLVHDRPAGDAYFPPWDQRAWRLVREEHHPADEKNTAAVTFRVLERVSR